MGTKYDFSGYATKNNLLCSDGRVICKDAFKDNDGTKVPLVWQHIHDNPMNVIGHAVLENREDGVYAYGYFNDTDNAKQAKELVKHGDITSLSIYANKLTQDGRNVTHGVIREVSLVYAGANPGAMIEDIGFSHADGSFEEIDEAVIYTGEELEMENENEIEHADDSAKQDSDNSDDRTVQDVFNTLNEEQKKVVYILIGQALEDAGVTDNDEAEHGEEEDMKKNIFENADDNTNVLTHSEMEEIFADAKQHGSLKDAVLAHGITDIDILFPEAKLVTPTPEIVAREMEWVSKVWSGTHKSRFSRIKSTIANLTRDEARARGYIKGNKKIEEQFNVLYRTTTPQTVYKLQKLDRDDILDITDFDVVAWLKAEMRMMLNEEIARAILIGDGRQAGTPDKIDPLHVRPIYQDADLYTVHTTVDLDPQMDTTERSNAIVDAAIRARKYYRGSGAPKFYASPDTITDLLLAKDKMGRRMYNTIDELTNALRVTEIIEVPIFEGINRTDDDDNTHYLLGLIVNLNDYNIGADRGGEVSMFDDFDLNYNKYEYLLETRISGALTKPYSAIALEVDTAPATSPIVLDPGVQSDYE